MPFELVSFSTAKDLAADVARRWRDRVRSAAVKGTSHPVAVSGGRIAVDLFQAVVAQEPANPASQDWKQVEFFWADERCVPPGHPDSNYRSASQHLLGPLGIPENNIHRIIGEIDPVESARQASEGLRVRVPTGTDGIPILDLVLLGMGEDGHVASLFPGAEPLVTDAKEPFISVTGPKPPPLRVTMTFATLAAAREVWVLVSGSGKENALRNSMADGGLTPLGRLLQMRGAVLFSSVPLV